MKRSLRAAWVFAAVLSVCGVLACGGGGGGDDDNNADSLACNVVGRSSLKSARIINGDRCDIGDSAVVLIHLIDGSGNDVGTCSGTAITSTAVLTAAHCFQGGIARAEIETEAGSFPSSSIAVHPNFSSVDDTQLRDAAVVRVGQSLGTQTFALLNSRNALAGEEAIIAGYGLDEDENDGRLRAGTMLVGAVGRTSIEAEYNGTRSNTCFGDSGGPLFVNLNGTYVLAGVTSSGILENCGEGDVSTFTNLSSAATLNFILGAAPGAVTR